MARPIELDVNDKRYPVKYPPDTPLLNFANYRVPRFRDVPEIEAVLLDRKDIPSAGAGETPIMAIAPAVGNSIFDATGVRLNGLPLVPNGLRSA